jgi:formylglycine-generating enzyme required for sulfatase activity
MFKRGCPDDFIRYVEGELGLDASVLQKYPVRTEPISEFWISRTPVTNAHYFEFVQGTGHRYPAGWRGTTPPYPVADGDKPVTGVNFQDCVDFASWVGARLPTRAEHEKASRGEEGILYPWGDEFDKSKCNTGESDRDELTPVDAFAEGESPYGVLDLVGNAWEWVDGKRSELTMTVGASYRAAGEIYGVSFFDLSRPPESSERDLGFRIACADLGRLLLDTKEISGAE